jgi:hypothetical protein
MRSLRQHHKNIPDCKKSNTSRRGEGKYHEFGLEYAAAKVPTQRTMAIREKAVSEKNNRAAPLSVITTGSYAAARTSTA